MHAPLDHLDLQFIIHAQTRDQCIEENHANLWTGQWHKPRQTYARQESARERICHDAPLGKSFFAAWTRICGVLDGNDGEHGEVQQQKFSTMGGRIHAIVGSRLDDVR